MTQLFVSHLDSSSPYLPTSANLLGNAAAKFHQVNVGKHIVYCSDNKYKYLIQNQTLDESAIHVAAAAVAGETQDDCNMTPSLYSPARPVPSCLVVTVLGYGYYCYVLLSTNILQQSQKLMQFLHFR